MEAWRPWVKRIPIVLGLATTAFWLLSFGVALGAFYLGDDSESRWWNLAFLREPGFWLGNIVFTWHERALHVDYGYVLSDGWTAFLVSLVVTAFGIGVGAWTLAQLALSFYLRLRKVPETSHCG